MYNSSPGLKKPENSCTIKLKITSSYLTKKKDLFSTNLSDIGSLNPNMHNGIGFRLTDRI